MNVLVVGDVIIDRYIHGSRRGLSAETPTIVANLGKEEMFVGGAGLVARHLLRLGSNVTLATVVPPEFTGKIMSRLLQESNDPVTRNEMKRFTFEARAVRDWKMTEKRRYFVEQYKLLQYDVVNETELSILIEIEFSNRMRKLLRGKDALVICDNRHGTLTESIAKSLVKFARGLNIPVFVDSQVSQSKSNHEWYKGADFVFLNEHESNVLGSSIESRKTGKGIPFSSIAMISFFLKSNIVYKRGYLGAMTFCRDGRNIVSPGLVVDAVDTCGAGDALLAAFVFHDRDLDAANRWAALSTTYKGTIVPTIEDLKRIKNATFT